MKKNVLTILLLSLILSACSTKKNISEPNSLSKDLGAEEEIIELKNNDDDENFEKLIDEYSKSEEIEGVGILTPMMFGYNEELGIDGTDNDLVPYNYVDNTSAKNLDLFISSAVIMKLELSEEGISLFNQSEPLLIFGVKIKSVNKSDDNAYYHAALTKLIIGEEEISSDPFFSSEGSEITDFIPPGDKIEETVGFVLPKDYLHKKITLDLSQYLVQTPEGKELPITFNMLNIEEAVKKDN